MNRLSGIITDIKGHDGLTLVSFSVFGAQLSSISFIDCINDSTLKIGNRVSFIFKESDTALMLGPCDTITIRNRIPCTVQSVEKGEVLSRVNLSFEGEKIVSVVSTESVESLGIREGIKVTALIKSTEVSIVEDLL